MSIKLTPAYPPLKLHPNGLTHARPASVGQTQNQIKLAISAIPDLSPAMEQATAKAAEAKAAADQIHADLSSALELAIAKSVDARKVADQASSLAEQANARAAALEKKLQEARHCSTPLFSLLLMF